MRIFLALALSLILPLAVAAQPLDAAHIARLDSLLARFTVADGPGCAVAITRHGQVVYERGFGLASIEQRVPITPRTVFDLGSVSKQFTAASIILLQLDGKLDLDDDVRRYLPELPDLGAKVTLRHLITHTSGWRDYNDLLIMDGWDERDHTTARDAWDSLKRQRALNFPPGSTYRYSNTGFFLLGEVVQRVSGQSLARFAGERIFKPLSMTHTRYLDDTRQIVANRATGYAPADSGYVVEMSDWDQVGDGAVQTSVEDMARWEANFETGVVGGRPLLDLLATPGRLNDGTAIFYSAGMGVTNYRGVPRLSHGGAWAGYRAWFARFPGDGLGILVTCNCADGTAGTLVTGLADMVEPVEPRRAIEKTMEKGLNGYFVSSATGVGLMVETIGDTLCLGAPGTKPAPLTPDGPATWSNAVNTRRIWFTGGRLIFRSLGDVPDTLDRVERVKEVPPARLNDYEGTYSSPEIATAYQVVARNGTLFLHLFRGDDIALTPNYVDAFDSATLPTIRFLRDKSGNVTELSFTGRGIHDLRMQRNGR